MLCKYCGKDRSKDEFQVARIKNGKIYKRRKCTTCKIKAQKERLKRIKVIIEEYKEYFSCRDCGNSDFRCLVFHHNDRKTKDIEICDAIRKGWSIDRIMVEVEKCSVLCQNCHMILHYEERIKTPN